MAQVNPSTYCKNVRVGNGQELLYVHLQNYLYRSILAVLVFYKKILKDLESQGFELNIYDVCVVHNMVNGKHMMIV